MSAVGFNTSCLLLYLLVENTTTAPVQASVVLQSAFHTLSLKIFHQQVTDFTIHRRSEMLFPVKGVDHLPW
jgi:hypothetical protein